MTRKHLLLSGVSALSVGLLVGAANAQQMETVVVTGIRASLQSAQAIKENADQVVDSITATDIGALPDRNVAEALQRVPGVTLQRNDAPNDLTRMGSTGTSVFIRGLSWVTTTMNGRSEFSALDGSTLSFADISADLMSGVDVYKSPTADMIEGGIGGTIDLKTRKPFDRDDRVIAISGDYTYGDKADRALPSANALYSDRFKTGIGEFGVLASVDWQDQITRTEGFNLGSFQCWNKATGATVTSVTSGYDSCLSADHVMAPNFFAWRQMEFKQQRLASNFVLQWRPNEHWEITASALNSYAHFTDVEHYVSMNINNDYNDYLANATYDSSGNWVKGSAPLTSFDTRAGTGHNRTSDLNLNVKWNPDDNWEISTDFQFVESDRQYVNNTMYTGLRSTEKLTLDITSKDSPKVLWTDDGAYTNKDNYFWYAAMDHMDYNIAQSYAVRADATYKFGGDGLFGFFKQIQTGFRSEQKLSVKRSTGYNWASIDPINWGAPGVTLAGNLTGSTYTAMDGSSVTANSAAVEKMNGYAELFSYQKIFGNTLPKLYVPAASLVAMDTSAATALTHTINPGWGGWTSYTADVGCTTGVKCIAAYENTTVGGSVSGNTISPQKQGTYAGYVQTSFAQDTLLGLNVPINGNIGFRVVHTQREVEYGKLVMPAAPTTSNKNCYTDLGAQMGTDASTVITSCTDWDTAIKFWGNASQAGMAVLRPDPVKTSYTEVLPSFNLIAHLSDTVQGRVGYSETMLRPDFGYTNNDGTLSFNWGGQSTAQAYSFSTTPSGYAGNPYLKPMHSVNYDASVEWYFSPSGSLTLSLFDKRITNYIYTKTWTDNITNPYSGQAYPFSYTTYVNGAKGGVDGWEIAYQQFFDMLPGFWNGFGVQANYTKIYNWGGHNNSGNITASDAVSSGNANLPMEGMSKDSYNVALMYAKYDVDFRLAWNWRSTYMSSSANSNAPREPVWIENYGQLDGSLFYTFLDHYKAGVQLTNITGSPFYTDEGFANYHPRVNWIKTDRKYAFVVRANW